LSDCRGLLMPAAKAWGKLSLKVSPDCQMSFLSASLHAWITLS
jgi:hypothetical protein